MNEWYHSFVIDGRANPGFKFIGVEHLTSTFQPLYLSWNMDPDWYDYSVHTDRILTIWALSDTIHDRKVTLLYSSLPLHCHPCHWLTPHSSHWWRSDTISLVISTRLSGKTRGDQQCIFDVFLTKPVGVKENLGVERHQSGLNPPTNRALLVIDGKVTP